MARGAVAVLLFLACACAAPGKPKFTFAKNSAVGLGVAGHGSEAHGVVEGKDTSVEAPFPGHTGDNVPDVTLVEDVNLGGAFAYDHSITAGVVKNSEFEDQNINPLFSFK